MTDILVHNNISYGKTAVEKTMDTSRGAEEVKYKSIPEKDEDIAYELSQKMDNASDCNVNKPDESNDKTIKEEQVKVQLANPKEKAPRNSEVPKEEQGMKSHLEDMQSGNVKGDMATDERVIHSEETGKENNSEHSCKGEDEGETINKYLKDTENNRHESYSEAKFEHAEELVYNSEGMPVDKFKGKLFKHGVNGDFNTNHLSDTDSKFENRDTKQDVFSFEESYDEQKGKRDRKNENFRKGRYHPQKFAVNGSFDNSEEDMGFSEDSDTEMDYFKEMYLLKSFRGKNDSSDGKDLLKFAEVLYKCTLCTSIPSILTSEESFIRHVNKQHLSKDTHCHTCKLCFLKFRTEEDLKEHIIFSHTGSDENLSCDLTGSDIAGSHDNIADSYNDSDSDSSGHRQLRTKVVKRSKPVQDFESPKQLVDHTGIETLNGSLDLTQKSVDEKKEFQKYTSAKTPKEGNEINIKQITDQIIKSDVQGRNVSNGTVAKLPFVPSFTSEFGKYTKLVREGGNIVYFCQICNWKSPIKTTFQVHCNMSSHKSKVLSAENPEENSDPNTKSQKHKNDKSKSPVKTETQRERQECKRQYSAQDISVGPRMPDQNLFYNYIMRPRAVTQSRTRTPVVSPYGTSNFIEDARFTYKRPSEHPVDLAMKKRKRLIKHSKFGQNTDSESEEEGNVRSCPSTKSSHSSNMTLLRQKLLEGTGGHKQHHQSMQKVQAFQENSNLSFDLFPGSNNSRFESYNKTFNLTPIKKEKVDGFSREGTDLNKRWKYMEKMKNSKTCRFEKDSMYKFRTGEGNKNDNAKFAGYKCHACSFTYSEVEEYERHFDKVHKATVGNFINSQRDTFGPCASSWTQGQVDPGSGSKLLMESGLSSDGRAEPAGGRNGEGVVSGSCEMGENWRVQKLKEILPDYVIECDRGNTSRDYLLQCISNASGIQDAVLWSSACNRAMRELFPNSQAQRKGKYKKTYYFGIAMLDVFQTPDEVPGTEGESPLYQPHRDINMDMEKIVEYLPSILKWTGNMECGVHRQDLLILLSDAIHDSDVSNWGAQCNRAIRLVFPNVDMKRKGKYKTTMYLGVEFHEDVLKRFSRISSRLLGSHNTDLSRRSPVNMATDNIVATDQKKGRTLERLLTRGSNSPELRVQHGESSSKNSSSALSYPQWMKKEAQDEMGQYLAKFGGVTMFETQNESAEEAEMEEDVRNSVTPVYQGDGDVTADNVSVDQGDDNDGDDEGESLDSVQTQ